MENRIRERRKELGLSQEELARQCGVSRQTVNAIENNKYDPTLSLAFHLARELRLTVDELFIPSSSGIGTWQGRQESPLLPRRPGSIAAPRR